MADMEDAKLIVQLAQWGTMMGLDEALKDVLAEDFSPEKATIEDDSVRRLLQFGETVGTLTKNGLLSQELVLDWLWVAGMWERVAPAARAQRKKHGVDAIFENFEALAAAQS
ncbi:MAG: hypothetical protein M3O90_04660 [Actinomycetota bacterium]|nr:hypothetical protein [Actinomycetota bacterium]